MSISSEEAAAIRAEQAVLKESVSQVVEALHENTKVSGEMLLEMRERDVRDEYRDKEFAELKQAVLKVDKKIDDYIDDKQTIIDWAERRMSFYDKMLSGMTSTWAKMLGAILVVGVLMVLGLDVSKIIK